MFLLLYFFTHNVISASTILLSPSNIWTQFQTEKIHQLPNWRARLPTHLGCAADIFEPDFLQGETFLRVLSQQIVAHSFSSAPDSVHRTINDTSILTRHLVRQGKNNYLYFHEESSPLSLPTSTTTDPKIIFSHSHSARTIQLSSNEQLQGLIALVSAYHSTGDTRILALYEKMLISFLYWFKSPTEGFVDRYLFTSHSYSNRLKYLRVNLEILNYVLIPAFDVFATYEARLFILSEIRDLIRFIEAYFIKSKEVYSTINEHNKPTSINDTANDELSLLALSYFRLYQRGLSDKSYLKRALTFLKSVLTSGLADEQRGGIISWITPDKAFHIKEVTRQMEFLLAANLGLALNADYSTRLLTFIRLTEEKFMRDFIDLKQLNLVRSTDETCDPSDPLGPLFAFGAPPFTEQFVFFKLIRFYKTALENRIDLQRGPAKWSEFR